MKTIEAELYPRGGQISISKPLDDILYMTAVKPNRYRSVLQQTVYKIYVIIDVANIFEQWV